VFPSGSVLSALLEYSLFVTLAKRAFVFGSMLLVLPEVSSFVFYVIPAKRALLFF